MLFWGSSEAPYGADRHRNPKRQAKRSSLPARPEQAAAFGIGQHAEPPIRERFAKGQLLAPLVVSFCQEQTFAVADLNDRLWSDAAASPYDREQRVCPNNRLPCLPTNNPVNDRFWRQVMWLGVAKSRLVMIIRFWFAKASSSRVGRNLAWRRPRTCAGSLLMPKLYFYHQRLSPIRLYFSPSTRCIK